MYGDLFFIRISQYAQKCAGSECLYSLISGQKESTFTLNTEQSVCVQIWHYLLSSFYHNLSYVLCYPNMSALCSLSTYHPTHTHTHTHTHTNNVLCGSLRAFRYSTIVFNINSQPNTNTISLILQFHSCTRLCRVVCAEYNRIKFSNYDVHSAEYRNISQCASLYKWFMLNSASLLSVFTLFRII